MKKFITNALFLFNLYDSDYKTKNYWNDFGFKFNLSIQTDFFKLNYFF